MRLSRRYFAKGLASMALMPVAAGVAARQATDSGLQARLLRRSDGALYVCKDGVRYRVRLPTLSDAVIDALPEARTSVDRLDQLFATPAQEPVRTKAAAPDTVLYETRLSGGLICLSKISDQPALP